MLHNYIVIAWRNIWKNKIFSLINIFGLSVGIAFTLLIGGYVWQELSVNSTLKNSENQYILQSRWKDPNMGPEITTVAELPRALKDQYPNLVANYYHWDAVTSNISKGDNHFRESIAVGDSTLLKMYGFKLIDGDAETALNEPYSVVITAEKATKYFGKTDVVGQSLSIENFSGLRHDFKVTGVMQSPPKNSVTNLNDNNNVSFYLPISAAKFLGRTLNGWSNFYIIGLIELQKGVNPKDVDAAMASLIKKNASSQMSANLTPYLVPLKSYYLTADNGLVKRLLYTLSLIALFILLMAIINFVNICISRSSQRMKEMGIRKVLGGLRKHLIWQFLIESVLMVLLATLLAFVIYAVATPFFSDMLSTEITGVFSFPLYLYLLPFALAIAIGLLAGIYPALVLSSLKSVDSLKGKLKQVKDKVIFRKLLVAFQFGTAATILISAVIISKQINLFFGKNLGYNKDYVVYAQLPRDWSKQGVRKMESIRYQMAQIPQVNNISLSYSIPNGNNGGNLQVFKMSQDSTQVFTSISLVTDNQFAATYNIPLKAGEFFKPQYMASDSAKVVVNEAQTKSLGFTDPRDAIGQQFRAQGAPVYTICGVVKDFQFGSMQQKIEPITFTNVNYQPFYRFFSIKLKPGNMENSLGALKKKWAELMPGAPFEYNFVDDALNKIYKTEIQLKKASYIATVLTIVIVLLGVLGLISISIQKRTKEIGIRKVLGSSVYDVIILFLKDFLVTVVIAGLAACPLAYLLMEKWLNDYAYRINITPIPFVFAIGLLTALTTVLIGIQTIRAASVNPVKSLRAD